MFELKKKKKEATSSFTSTIQPTTPSSKIWANIRRFCGLNPVKQIHATNPENNETTLASNEIANIFAQHYSQQPIHKNSTDPFLKSKKPIGNSSTHLPTKPTRNTHLPQRKQRSRSNQ